MMFKKRDVILVGLFKFRRQMCLSGMGSNLDLLDIRRVDIFLK